ncbi:pantetheinase-like [Haliotis rubra]|uniref:pantetheinase-like n=1 Tax=Haliotis rubra TaxID=36100 RepID=UPI001EE57F92|nr:pantetheinase-like [Haliotis rubra]
MDMVLGCRFLVVLAGWVLMTQASPLTFSPRGGYRAAVYEHAVHIPWSCLLVPVSRGEAVRQMMKNIQVYKMQAAAAAREGADIIVFPEDGIYGMIFSRNTIKPFLEEIPDPRITEWNPCVTSGSDIDVTIQRELSCIARDNAMYVVANMGDRKPCNHSNDPKCPEDDQYQYNTDVTFNPEGVLVARYHKRHLFKENQFDTPPLELATFETPFGKFGLITCFDILFYDPSVELIQKEGVRNIIFPTAWMDRLPYLAAVEFHSAFAKGLGVNVLGANIHYPVYKFHGSGIYTPKGSVTYYYNDSIFSGGKLLVADVDSIETDMQYPLGYLQRNREKWRVVKMKQNKRETSEDRIPSLVSEERLADTTDTLVDRFNVSRLSSLPRENYTFVALEHHAGNQSACRDEVCCTVVYSRENTSAHEDLFVLAVFNGLDDGRFTQICSVLMCPGNNMSNCGEPVTRSSSMFNFVEISGNLSTPYIFPEVLVSNGDYIGLVQGEWTFTDRVLHGGNGFSKPLITASLFGRLYSRDNSTLT